MAIDINGAGAVHLIAFARVYNDRAALVLCPRLSSSRLDEGIVAAPQRWSETVLNLPSGFPLKPLRDVFSKRTIADARRPLKVAALLAESPVALFLS